MPTYDYVCDACGHELELFQSITAPTKRKCPACGKNKFRRRIGSGAGILFKGTGFYQTDYRSASYEAGAKGEGSGPSEPSPAEPKTAEPKTGERKAGEPRTSEPESKPTPSPTLASERSTAKGKKRKVD